MAAYDWDSSWTTTTGIDGATITNASDDITEAISNDGKLGTLISVVLTYGATATQGVKVYLLKDIDGTNYEGEADSAAVFDMPYSTSTTYRKSFPVPGWLADNFKIFLTNDSGASVTSVTVRYKQAIV